MQFLLQASVLVALCCGANAALTTVPSQVYASVGSTYSVNCSCDLCSTIVTFTFNNDANPPDATRYRVVSQTNAAWLTVINVQPSDGKVTVVCQTVTMTLSQQVGVTVYSASSINGTAEISKTKTVNLTVNVLSLNNALTLGMWYRGVYPNGTLVQNSGSYAIYTSTTNMTNSTSFYFNSTYELMITKPDATHVGPYYVLLIESANLVIYSYLNSYPILTFEPAPEGGRSFTTYDGSTFQVSCIAQGYPQPSSVSWTLVNEGQPTIDVASWPRAKLSTNRLNQTNGSLEIVDIDYTNRATFTCTAVTSIGNSSVGYLVRVKDPLAALWPAIGVAVEIVVLAAIIVLYEKFKDRFSSSDSAEDDDDGRADGAHSDNRALTQPSGVELRQRNAHP